MFIIRPYGMTEEVADMIIKARDICIDEYSEFDEWLRSHENKVLLDKFKVYRLPGEIASFFRGVHDNIGRQRPLAYNDYYGKLVDTVEIDPFTKEKPNGWFPTAYVEGWNFANDTGKFDYSQSRSIRHYRFTCIDGGNGWIYIKEMSFNEAKGEYFEWNKVSEYVGENMTPCCIESLTVEPLRGRTINDGVLEIPSCIAEDNVVRYISHDCGYP